MREHEEERERARARLARYRVGTSERFRFKYRRHRAFVASCLLVGFGFIVPFLDPIGDAQRVLVRVLGLAGVLGMSLLLPGVCWFEVEQRPASWIFRRRFGWWTRVDEVPAEQIALASIVEDKDEHERLLFRNLQIARIAQPFARSAPPPLSFSVRGWSPREMLSICRLITPGYESKTYLLQTDIAKRAKRRTSSGGARDGGGVGEVRRAGKPDDPSPEEHGGSEMDEADGGSPGRTGFAGRACRGD